MVLRFFDFVLLVLFVWGLGFVFVFVCGFGMLVGWFLR